MSREPIQQLIDAGVKTIDVSGVGGTNFAKIESYRRKTGGFEYLLDFGQSTAVSFLEAQEFLGSAEIIASGGIRHPLDIVKSLALGAKAVGVAGLFLNLIQNDGIEKTIETVNSWKDQIKSLLALLGKPTLDDLITTDLIIQGNVKEWCLARGIPIQHFARRSSGNSLA